MNEIYKSGLSGDRVMELLRRQYAVPTLPAAPTDSTFSWVDDMGYANTFRVGELCRVKDDDDYIFYILEELKDGEATWIPLSGGGSGEQPEMEAIDRLLKQKLDNLFFSRLFVAIDANGIEISPNDTTTPIASIRANYGLWTEYFLSAKGRNPSTGSSSGGDGASTLGGLNNVADGADVGEEGYDVAKMLVLEANSNLWTLRNLSELVGLDEDALLAYLTNNNYAKKSDIPSLTGYATESWVLGKGYATTSDLDARIGALVNGAPAAYDTLKEIADVLGKNVDSIADILDALGTKANKVDVDAAISAVNASISALNTELSGKIDLKLDAATFNELFEKVLLEDGKTYAIRAKLGLFSDSFLSAKGANSSGGSSSGGAGALYQLADVLADGQQVSGAATGALLMYNGTQWQGVSQSEIVPNLTGYAKLTDIPTDDINKGVTAYGWGDHSKVGYLTSITSALVTGALGFTPFDSANFTKAKIKSTLGISDWALASSKPSYTTSEVTEGANLYFTNARAVAALKSITDGLGSDISTLQGYFTNGVAKSAARLSTNTVYKAWGQTFFENGVPKAVSGALTDVTDITSSGTITTNKIVIGDGAIEWDSENKGFKIVGGLYTESYLSAKGANSSGSSSSGGQYTRLDEWTNYSSAYDTWVLSAKLGKGLYDTQNSLLTRVGALEGKATNVSFTQSLTSGTQIGSISIDGVTKNIYAPTIPTADINKGVTAYGWGNHANAGYLTQHQDLSGYQTKITSSNKLSYSLISGTPTIPTALKSPYALTFGSKTYDGSAAKTIVASDLGALTAHQTIYALTIKNSAGTTQLTYTPNSAVGSLTLTKAMVGLGNVENTALSTWVGTNKITTLGTITSGTWNGTKIANSYLANSAITIAGTSVSLGSSITATTLQSNLGLGALAYKGSLSFSELTNKPTTISGYGITDGVTAGAINSADSILTWAQSNPSYIGSINSGGWSNIISVRHRNNQGDGVSYGMLLYSPLTSNGALKYRQQASGNWQDERTILDNISYTDYTYSKSTIDTKLGGYLPLSGGTITSASGDLFCINRTSGNPQIRFEANGGLLGYIGFTSGNAVVRLDSTYYNIIHSGSIGSQSVNYASGAGNADTLDELHASDFARYVAGATYDANTIPDGVYGGKLFNASNWNNNFAAYLSVGVGNYKMQFNAVDNILAFRTGGTSNLSNIPWKTIAFTDSNVASATKLQTARSIWGQSFDGTGNVSGSISLGNDIIYGASSRNAFQTSGTDLYIGSGYTASGDRTFIYGNVIRLYTGEGSQSMLINSSGNVGIGTTSPQYKLDVNGVIHSTTGIFSDGYVSAKGQNTSSDMRLKNVLGDVELGVSAIANAPSVRFEWKNGGGVDVGSIAQYWQNVLPDAVKERDGMLEMQYANIALLSAIAIAKRVETHEERIERLEREVKELRIENERLKIGGRYAE